LSFAARRRLFSLAMALPVAIYLLLVFAYPIGQEIYLSFTNARLLERTPPVLVGLDNYRSLAESRKFWLVIGNTLFYAIAANAVILVLGLGLALLLNQAFHGRKLARVVSSLPWAFPEVAAVLVWSWMYNKDFGVMNVFARWLPGVSENPNWLLDPAMAWFSIVLMTVWKIFPFFSLIILTALQLIDKELYAAAKIDGAGSLQLFRHITLPGIAPTLGIMTLLITVWGFRRFPIIYLMTGGGPGVRTATLVVLTYITAIKSLNIGLGAAMAIVGLIMSLMITVLYVFVTRRLGQAQI
jgi:multiple sugar transport system permease protein